MIIADRLTPLSRDEAAQAFLAAYKQLTGTLPTPGVLALLLAQSAFETGHWKSLHHFNFGNAKAGPGYPLVTQFRCSELDAEGVEHFYEPPDPHCNFRAYESAEGGALDYLRVLQKRPHWWQGLHTEDPVRFVDALATPPRYFTGNPAIYKRGVLSLFQTFYPLAEVALAVASVRPQSPPACAPMPGPSLPSASPLSASSGAWPAPQSDSDSGSSKAEVARVRLPPVWRRVLGFLLRLASRLLRRPPPRGGA